MTTEKKEAANTIFCARSLGEGKIVRLLKRYAFIDDQRLGKIYAPLEACQSFFPNANDLRDVFKENDLVVFTAHRQTEKTNNDCKYVASSVVQKDRLFNCYGKVTEVSEKYAYAEAPKYGRIFLPFSARNEQNRPWLGRGAVIGKKVYLRIMPQPEVNKCAHVAYGVSLNYPENSALTNGYEYETTNSSSLSDSAKFSIGGRIERQPDAVSEQLGIFIKHIDNDVLIYAPQTGLVNVPNSLLNSINSGNFVHFDALKSISKQREKCTWSAKKVEPIGNLVKILPDFPSRFIPFNEDRLTIEVDAVVCRVSNANSSAWLWNDLVGRIFVNNHVYLGGLRALDVVHVKAQFTAAFEDVPWSAVEIDFIGDDVEKRSEIAQLLVTDDRWEVLYVSEQASGTFFGFMENEALGSAFMAWTDLTEGESPPAKGDICRVTAYRQNRDRKHEWRALLVTPFDQNKNEPIFYHPYVKTTGQLDENIINEVRRMKSTRRPPMEKKIVPSAIMSSIDSGRDSNDVAPPGFEPTPIGSTRIRSTASSDVSSDNAFDVEQSYLSYHKDSNHHPLLSFPLNENRSSTESMNTPDIGTRSIFDAWVSPNERLLPDWKFESPFDNLRSESMNISEENHRPRSGASSVPPNNNANTNGSNTYDSFNSPFITPVAEKFQRQQLSERRQEQSNLPRYMPQPLGLFNGVAGLGQPPSLFPVTSTNGHLGAISSDAAIQTDADSDSYENFLLGEIRKRPKLLCRIISEDLGADIYQILLDLMKRKGSNR